MLVRIWRDKKPSESISQNEGARKRGTHHSRGKSLVKLASPLSPRVPTPGRRKTGSGWPSDNRTWCQCLRRHDLNSVSDSAKIRWIDIIVNRR
jgi:hypothetical protein